jgi:hypothetical protein
MKAAHVRFLKTDRILFLREFGPSCNLVSQNHKVRSHLLNPGIASFSIMTGSNTTIKRNHRQNAATQRAVCFHIDVFGGSGKGLNCDCSLNLGTGGKGFACATAGPRPGLGGTGGPSVEE